MQHEPFHLKYRGWILFALLCVLWIPWLGDTPFYSKGEPREAIVAVSMLQSGDWVLPVNGGWEYPFKPPLLAWIIACIAAAFNGGTVNEFISRLPSALAAIGMIMAGFHWAKRTKGIGFATQMAIVTATSFEVFRAAMACRLDMLLTAAMVCALYCMFLISERSGRNNLWLYAVAALLLTCAVLTKGPVGALLPCLIAGIYRLLRGENFLKTLGSLSFLAITAFIIPAIWYYAAWKRGGDVFLDLAWEENIGRLTGTMSYESHVKPVWYNFMTILAGMLPWTLLPVLAIVSLLRRRLNRINLSSTALFSLVAALTVILFYCIPASKRSVYLLSAYPFMAYGVTVIIEQTKHSLGTTVFSWIIGLIGILAPSFILVKPFTHLMPYELIIEGFFAYAVLILTLLTAAWWLFCKGGRLLGLNLVVFMLFLSYSAAVMPAVFREPLKTAQATEIFQKIRKSDAQVRTVGNGRMADEVYWFNFYLNDRIRRVTSVEEAAQTLPEGAILILPTTFDSEPLRKGGNWTIHLLPFNPDTRRPIYVAIHK